MDSVFTPLDFVLFLGFLILAMAIGLIAGRKEDTSEDFFLAGRKVPWWGVAGSIFGSNVSANHMVGMMGIGFSIGFAQSHFELGAIFGLMLLCYGFLPVYRKLKLYTLSEYLERRYDERSRICYAIIMVIIMALIHLVPALYIGSRSICVLFGGDAVEQRVVVVEPAAASLSTTSQSDGTEEAPTQQKRIETTVNKNYYAIFVIALAVISASYTIFGGLKAVIWTDVIQSVLLLIAGIVVAVLTFQAVGGWGEAMALDKAAGADSKMSLYLPMDHARLPWTGVFTGLMFMHCFYWGTNQFIVQRALAAQSDTQARTGIIAAGFLKLLIPFFSVASGVAAVYLFKQRQPDMVVAPDTAFTEVVKLVVPLGVGIVGLIAAGLIGAILSSIDSMMNSAATIVTVDVYKRYLRRDASDREMILVGRISIVVFVVIAALMAIFVVNPYSKRNFFLTIADYQNYLTPGILVAFLMGMFWRRGTALAGFVTILAGVFFSWLIVWAYDGHVGVDPAVYKMVQQDTPVAEVPDDQLPPTMKEMSVDERQVYIDTMRGTLSRDFLPSVSRMNVMSHLGPRINFFHRVVGVIGLCVLLYVCVSLLGKPNPEKSRLTWTDLGGHDPRALQNIAVAFVVSIAIYVALGYLLYHGQMTASRAAWMGSSWTFLMFLGCITFTFKRRRSEQGDKKSSFELLFTDDRLWAGLLCSTAVFMLYYFA